MPGHAIREMTVYAAACGLALAIAGCGREQPSEQEAGYPAPRYPAYLVKTDPGGDDLMAAARSAVRQPYGRSPLGKVQSGQTIHVILQYGQDREVWEAIQRAWKERGVNAQAIGSWELMGMSEQAYDEHVKKNLLYGNEAWQELGVFRPVYQQFFPEDVRNEFKEAFTSTVVRKEIEAFLENRPEINFFFAGTGGGNFWARAAGKHGHKFVGNWIYSNKLELLGKASQFPGDLWNMVDDKVLKPIPHVREGTFTDPEGTKLRWSVNADQAQQWSASSGDSNHLYIYPAPVRATWTERIIRASANHTGFYPAMTVRISGNGRVEAIDGGGRTGELFRMLLEHPKMKSARFPGAPEPGYWYLTKDGFATNPKFVRDMPSLLEGAQNISNLSERNRAGVQHFSFSYPGGSDTPELVAYAKQLGVPLDHTSHMHVYFPTIRWRLGDTDEWVTIADRGQLKAFEDPEVRALAAKYGDPDLLFRYEWIPSIPGVNVSGDYERDYAPDPWKWIVAEWNRIRNQQYEYFVDDYSLKSGAQ